MVWRRFVLAGLGLSACAMGPMPVAQSPADPSSPRAAEGAASPAGSPAGSRAGSPPEGPAEKASYTCPMHADVVSDAPGHCPKCHMQLVPKETPKP